MLIVGSGEWRRGKKMKQDNLRMKNHLLILAVAVSIHSTFLSSPDLPSSALCPLPALLAAAPGDDSHEIKL